MGQSCKIAIWGICKIGQTCKIAFWGICKIGQLQNRASATLGQTVITPEMRPRKDISWRKKGNSTFAWISGNSYVEIDFKWACALLLKYVKLLFSKGIYLWVQIQFKIRLLFEENW